MNRLLVICDSSDAAADIGSRLAGRFDMQFTGSGDVHEIAACDNLVVDIDLFDGRKVSAFAEWLRRRPAGGKVIFVVERGVRHQAVQAMAVGATDLISRPVDGDVLLEMIVGITECRADGSSADTIARSDSVHAGIYALDDAFQAACAGAPVDLQSIDAAGRIITSGMKVDGLAQWIDAVRSYHSQTYQHCLLVTGIAVTFGQRLGFRDGDQHKLAFAGLLHDIGKARIPLAILEKPEPLTPDEVSIMRQHPLLGLKVLARVPGLSAPMLDMVLHHHEYLDGSGYPHGLQSHEISDLVRIMTIADVFGALIERRAYKPPLSREAAYEVLKDMGPRLDRDLVREFRRLVDEPSVSN